MKRLGFITGICFVLSMAVGWPTAQTPAPAGQGQEGAARGGGGGTQYNWQYGSVTPATPDARGWGWQAKSYVSAGATRPFYNIAKELLFQDKQITSYTISTFSPELYCEVGKHFDYIWFEMQHSTMSFDEVRRMILTCPRVGAAPMIRMPDALEANIQKATDLGVLGIIVPTVDDALEARDSARFSRFPPFGRRSAGGGAASQLWTQPGVNYRATINDNMLVVVMIETLEGVANASEIAATQGVDAVIIGNNDLSSFSGWAQTDPRYQDAITLVHNATLKAGKYFGNAGAQYLTGNRLSANTRIVQNGPARDGWTPPARGRGRGPEEEPVIGMPGSEGGARGGRRGGGAQ